MDRKDRKDHKDQKVIFGRDSKGEYIKVKKYKVYLTKDVKEKLAKRGVTNRQSVTEYLVKWILKYLTRRRRKGKAGNNKKKGYAQGHPEAVGLENLRSQLATYSTLIYPQPLATLEYKQARPVPPALRPPTEVKLLPPPPPRPKVKKYKIRDNEGKESVIEIPEEIAKQLEQLWEAQLLENAAEKRGKLELEKKEVTGKLDKAKQQLDQLQTTGSPFRRQGSPDSLREQLRELGYTAPPHLSSKADLTAKLIELIQKHEES